MKKLFYMLAAALVLVSCAKSYNIEGSSNVSMLDGQKMYLQVIQDDHLESIDSCDVVHGKFHMHGTLDTIKIALLVNENLRLPLVLEEGDIKVSIGNAERSVSGTELNDSLFAFVKTLSQLESEENELIRTHDRAIMNGEDMDKVISQLEAEYMRIADDKDKLVTGFITGNFDNILGPGVFFMMTMSHMYPELSPWIEAIMTKASDKFKNDAYVKMYYERAKENEAIMNGTKDMPADAAPAEIPSTDEQKTD